MLIHSELQLLDNELINKIVKIYNYEHPDNPIVKVDHPNYNAKNSLKQWIEVYSYSVMYWLETVNSLKYKFIL